MLNLIKMTFLIVAYHTYANGLIGYIYAIAYKIMFLA